MKILLILITFTLFLNSSDLRRYSSTNIVKDTKNRLVWVDDESSVKLKLTHKDAEPYCENLVHGGLRNWRLATLEEFETIIDKLNVNTNTNKVFKYSRPNGYWAIKAHIRTFWFYADYMNFISGTSYYDNRNKKKFIRCVASMK